MGDFGHHFVSGLRSIYNFTQQSPASRPMEPEFLIIEAIKQVEPLLNVNLNGLLVLFRFQWDFDA